MSTRFNNGSHYENHPRAAELHEAPEHIHLVAEQKHDQQEHLTDHEQTRHELEHDRTAQHRAATTVGHGVTAFSHAEIEVLAYELWEARGRPDGSPEIDWHDAVKELRARAIANSAARSHAG